MGAFSSEWLFAAFVAAAAIERLAELRLSLRNAAWSFSRGGREYGQGHYPVMVVLHTALLLACVLEVFIYHRGFDAWIGWIMVATVIGTQALRWWCIVCLGQRWNTRVIVVPGLQPVTRGPYRWLRHPNYLAVALEGVALPMVHGAWLTALIFSLLNAQLLRTRIRCEEKALADAVEGLPTAEVAT